jgi:DNA-3-methyladenine glycosylase II
MTKEYDILVHFEKVDPILFAEAKRVGFHEMIPRKPEEYFASLCREIVGQQLSNKVARIIFGRFKDLVGEITPEQVLSVSDQELRDVGMAWSKVRSIKDLAQKVASKELDLQLLNTLNEEQIAEELIKVKGIGPWTTEMFLMFTLCREDIFSPGDLSLVRGISKIYRIDRPTKEQIQEITNKWKPYRTYASFVLWRSQEFYKYV